MAISALDLATVRRRTSAAEGELSDDVIDALYTSTTFGNSDLNLTTYYTLIELIGVLAVLVDVSDPTLPASMSHSQRFDHLMDKLLPLWAGITGISMGATLTAGVLNQSIDTTPDDLSNADASWLWS